MRERGVVTVFFAMILTTVLALLFTLMELGRVVGGTSEAKLDDRVGVSSVFAEFDRNLWERYHVFFLYGSYGAEEFSVEDVTARLSEKLERNAGIHTFLNAQVDRVEMSECVFMTDEDGAEYVAQAVAYEKSALGLKGLERLKEKLTGTTTETKSAEELMEEAESAVTEAEAYSEGEGAADAESPGQNAEGVATTESSGISFSEAKQLFSLLKQYVSRGVLSLVLNPGESISGKAISSVYSQRTDKRIGFDSAEKQDAAETDFLQDATTKLVFQEYLLDHFGCYGSEKDVTALSYEAEYLLCGKMQDEENLKGTVNKILAIREGINFAYLLTDPTKQGQAESVATALAGITGNPAIIQTVNYGILAGWAYAESLVEVRTLLHGGKISLVKSAETWNTDLWHIAESLETNGKSTENGLSYEDCLRVLLSTEKIATLSSRSLDLMEKNIAQEEYHANFRVDHCIGRGTFVISRSLTPLFLSLTGSSYQGYSFTDTVTNQYK